MAQASITRTTIELTTSAARARRDNPGMLQAVGGNRPVAIEYEVDRSRLSGKLAEFIADHIPTTRYDDASRLWIFTGLAVADDLARHGVAGHFGPIRVEPPAALGSLSRYAEWLEATAKALLEQAERVRKLGRAYGDESSAHVVQYRWPVFDERYEDAADYVNRCAGDIRSRGIPFDVGLSRARPPEGLARSIRGPEGVSGLHAKYEAYIRAREGAAA